MKNRRSDDMIDRIKAFKGKSQLGASPVDAFFLNRVFWGQNIALSLKNGTIFGVHS